MSEAKAEAAGARPQDRRAHPRFEVDQDAGMLLVDHGLALECRILDLSLEGCRLRAVGRLPEGLHARVEVTFTINGIPLRMGGQTLRSNGTGEVGVRFIGVSAHRRAEWAEVVDEVQEQAAVKAAEAARAAEAAAQEGNGGSPRDAAA